MKRETMLELSNIIGDMYNKNMIKEASLLEDTFIKMAQNDEYRDNYVENFLKEKGVDIAYLDPDEMQLMFQQDYPEEWQQMEDKIDDIAV